MIGLKILSRTSFDGGVMRRTKASFESRVLPEVSSPLVVPGTPPQGGTQWQPYQMPEPG